MKKNLESCSLFFIFCMLFSSFGFTAQWKMPNLVESIAGVEKVTVVSYYGSIKLIPSNSNQVLIRGLKTSRFLSPSEASKWNIVTQKEGQNLWVKVLYQGDSQDFKKSISDKNKMPALQMILQLKPDIPVDLRIRNGAISVSHWKAPVSVSQQKGSVVFNKINANGEIRSLSGKVTVSQHQGDIKLSGYESVANFNQVKGNLSLETFSGKLSLSQIDGSIKLDSTKSVVTSKNTEGNLEFNTDSGDISILAHTGSVQGTSDSGSVRLGVSGSPQVRIKSDQGNVELNLSRKFGLRAYMTSEKGRISFPPPLKLKQYPNIKVVQGEMSGPDRGRVIVKTKTGQIRLRR